MLNAINRLIGRATDSIPDEPAQPVDDVRTFLPTDAGSGDFGSWQIDSNGLPAYRYELDQYADIRARYPNSLGLDRRDHWYAIGNDRITGIASNDGTVQLYMGDRGGTLLNRFDDGSSPDDWIDGATFLPAPLRDVIKRWGLWLRLRRQDALLAHWRATHPTDNNKVQLAAEIQSQMAQELRTRPRNTELRCHYAGGFGFIDDGTEVWSTAFRYRPKGAETRRIFGMGYFETETTYRNIRAVRRVYAPYGDDPALIADVYLRNLSDQPITLKHYEYWDVNYFQMETSWFQTGLPALASVDSREEINDNFRQTVDYDAERGLLRSHMTAIAEQIPDMDDPSPIDWYPADVFLIDLQGKPSAVYTDKIAFFGDSDPRQPEAVAERQEGRLLEEQSAASQPFCLVQRRDLTLAPGEIVQLRYAYGAVRPDEQTDFVQSYRLKTLDDTLNAWKKHLVYFSTGGNPALQREMAWHAYCLQAASVYNAYHDAHVVTQGSAYLYLHGLDGAPRDQVLFAMPLSYIRPDLARETLTLLMQITRGETGAMSYAFSGHGLLDGALVHNKPSDLDLFFLLGLAEYVAATGDVGFLDKNVPFYPVGSKPASVNGETVLDHARVAFDHLMNGVGVGENGLIRVGDGDWADGVVIENAVARIFLGVSYELSAASGESIPNAQMAVYILPLVADMLDKHDPQLAERMRAVVPGLKAAVNRQWSGRWYSRAILRNVLNEPVIIGKYQLNLEAQPWALISGIAAEAGYEPTLIESIDTMLDNAAPTGAPYIERGQVSAAISQLLTWGYSRSRPDLAWRSLLRQTFATHAAVFPSVWFGIWTAPDALNGIEGARPGGTWASPVTPMTDYPALNSNPHAMALLSLIRLCGIEPVGDGLQIAPRIPKERFILDMPLIRLEVEPERIGGEYRAVNDGAITLHIELPKGVTLNDVSVNGQSIPTDRSVNPIPLPIHFKKGEKVSFNVGWALPDPMTIPTLKPIEEVRL